MLEEYEKFRRLNDPSSKKMFKGVEVQEKK